MDVIPKKRRPQENGEKSLKLKKTSILQSCVMTHRTPMQNFRVELLKTASRFADECCLGVHCEPARKYSQKYSSIEYHWGMTSNTLLKI